MTFKFWTHRSEAWEGLGNVQFSGTRPLFWLRSLSLLSTANEISALSAPTVRNSSILRNQTTVLDLFPFPCFHLHTNETFRPCLCLRAEIQWNTGKYMGINGNAGEYSRGIQRNTREYREKRPTHVTDNGRWPIADGECWRAILLHLVVAVDFSGICRQKSALGCQFRLIQVR